MMDVPPNKKMKTSRKFFLVYLVGLIALIGLAVVVARFLPHEYESESTLVIKADKTGK